MDSGSSINVKGLLYGEKTGNGQLNLSQLVDYLQDMYCGPVAAQFEHLEVGDITLMSFLVLSDTLWLFRRKV